MSSQDKSNPLKPGDLVALYSHVIGPNVGLDCYMVTERYMYLSIANMWAYTGGDVRRQLQQGEALVFLAVEVGNRSQNEETEEFVLAMHPEYGRVVLRTWTRGDSVVWLERVDG